MKPEHGRRIVKGLGIIAQHIKQGTNAPVVIILCMSGLKEGSILSACAGPNGAAELATALRRAADYTEHEQAEHLHQVAPKAPS